MSLDIIPSMAMHQKYTHHKVTDPLNEVSTDDWNNIPVPIVTTIELMVDVTKNLEQRLCEFFDYYLVAQKTLVRRFKDQDKKGND